MSNSHDVARSFTYKGRHRREAQQMRKAAFAVAAVGAAAAAPLLGGGVAHADGSVWDNVAQCESTGNWSINTGNGFSGGLQFTQSTWAAYGGTQYAPEAFQASREQQIAVAQRVLAGQGPGAWPVCSVKGGLTSSNGGASSAPVDNQQTQSQPTQQAQPQQKAAPQVAAPQAAAPRTESSTPATAINGPSYVVKTGDTLSKIANRAQVNWHTLYTQNKKVVGANPNVIYPGQQLQLG